MMLVCLNCLFDAGLWDLFESNGLEDWFRRLPYHDYNTITATGAGAGILSG